MKSLQSMWAWPDCIHGGVRKWSADFVWEKIWVIKFFGSFAVILICGAYEWTRVDWNSVGMWGGWRESGRLALHGHRSWVTRLRSAWIGSIGGTLRTIKATARSRITSTHMNQEIDSNGATNAASGRLGGTELMTSFLKPLFIDCRLAGLKITEAKRTCTCCSKECLYNCWECAAVVTFFSCQVTSRKKKFTTKVKFVR